MTTFSDRRQDRNRRCELAWVSWGPGPGDSYYEARIDVQIAGKPGEKVH